MSRPAQHLETNSPIKCDLIHTERFKSRTEELMAKHHCPGIAVAVVDHGKVDSVAFGQATVDPPVTCTADTIFDIASSSKSLTAAAVAVLVADDKCPEMKWDALMSELLPEDFQLCEPEQTGQVRLDDLVGHTTGMPGHDSSYMGTRAAQPDDAHSITRNLRNLPLTTRENRKEYLYCNMMYTALTYLVEVKSQKRFASFLQENIFDNLSMDSTCLQPKAAREKGLHDRIASGHCWRKKKGYQTIQPSDCPEGQGAGSTMTSVNDFILYIKALMNQEKPMTLSIFENLIRPRIMISPGCKWLRAQSTPTKYAAGMETCQYRGYLIVGHDGSIPGFGSRFFFIPDLKFGACIFGNSSEAWTVVTSLAREMIDEVLNVPDDDRQRSWKHARSEVPRPHDLPPQTQVAGNYGQHLPREKPKVARNGATRQEEPQIRDLNNYTGEYWNEGYRMMRVEVRDGKLFIDATDRAMGFTATFLHVEDQSKYTARLTDTRDGESDSIDAEFEIKDNRAMRMGLKLEDRIDDMIWFNRATTLWTK